MSAPAPKRLRRNGHSSSENNVLTTLQAILYQLAPDLEQYAQGLVAAGWKQPSDFEYMQPNESCGETWRSFAKDHGIPLIPFKRIVRGWQQRQEARPRTASRSLSARISERQRQQRETKAIELHRAKLETADRPLSARDVVDVLRWGMQPVIRNYMETLEVTTPQIQLAEGARMTEFQLENVNWMWNCEQEIRSGQACAILDDSCTNEVPADMKKEFPRLLSKPVAKWSGFVLADSVGFGKTLECLALVMMDRKKMQEDGTQRKYKILGLNEATGKCEKKSLADDFDCGFNMRVAVTATLVLCPPHLCKQWELQANIWKASNVRGWRVCCVVKESDFKPSILQLAKNYDVVIMNSMLLTNEDSVWFNKEKNLESFFTRKSSERSERYHRFQKLPEEDSFENRRSEMLATTANPIDHIFWRRVILDEAHEYFESSIHARVFKHRLTNHIFSATKIYLSGTPIPNEECYRGMMAFLNMRINDVPVIYFDHKKCKRNRVDGDLVWKDMNTSVVMKLKPHLCPILHNRMYRRQTMASICEADKVFFPDLKWGAPNEGLNNGFVYHELNQVERMIYDKVCEVLSRMPPHMQEGWEHLKIKACRHSLFLRGNLKQYSIKEGMQMKNKQLLRDMIARLDDMNNIYIEEVKRFSTAIKTHKAEVKQRHIGDGTTAKSEKRIADLKDIIKGFETGMRRNKEFSAIHTELIKELKACEKQVASSQYSSQKAQSSKLSGLMKLLKERLLFNEDGTANDNRAIVYTHDNKFAVMIRQTLKKHLKHMVVEIKGTSASKNKAVSRFKDDNTKRVALISGLATASGSDFGTATHVVLATAVDQHSEIKSLLTQIIGRARRLTVNNATPIYILQLVARNTVEEQIAIQNRDTVKTD